MCTRRNHTPDRQAERHASTETRTRFFEGVPAQSYQRFFIVYINILIVGIKPSLSFSCCSRLCLNATRPKSIPAVIKINETRLQRTPQHCEEPPYRLAKTLESEEFTFRKMRSSQI